MRLGRQALWATMVVTMAAAAPADAQRRKPPYYASIAAGEARMRRRLREDHAARSLQTVDPGSQPRCDSVNVPCTTSAPASAGGFELGGRIAALPSLRKDLGAGRTVDPSTGIVSEHPPTPAAQPVAEVAPVPFDDEAT